MEFDVFDFDELRERIYKQSYLMYLTAGRNPGRKLYVIWNRLRTEVIMDWERNGVVLAMCSPWYDARSSAERDRAAKCYAGDVLEYLWDTLRYGTIGTDWLPPDGAPDEFKTNLTNI